MQLDTAVKNLTNHGFSVRVFKTQQEAVSAISQELSGRAIGFGGSVTLQELGLFEKLSANNTVFWHWKQSPAEAREKAASAQVYMTSANAISETGEIINIDGTETASRHALRPRGALHHRGHQQACARPPLRYGARAEHCRAVKRPPLKLQNALRDERAHALS